MTRFLRSPFDRAMLLMFVGNVLVLVWLRPEIRGTVAAAQTSDAPRWAFMLLVVGGALMLYALLEPLLFDSFDDPPRRGRF